MANVEISEGLKNGARPPILDVLPAVLRRQPTFQKCFCRNCAPTLSDNQRAAHERVQDDWRFARIAWCDAHGYQFLDLIQAESNSPVGPSGDC